MEAAADWAVSPIRGPKWVMAVRAYVFESTDPLRKPLDKNTPRAEASYEPISVLRDVVYETEKGPNPAEGDLFVTERALVAH